MSLTTERKDWNQSEPPGQPPLVKTPENLVGVPALEFSCIWLRCWFNFGSLSEEQGYVSFYVRLELESILVYWPVAWSKFKRQTDFRGGETLHRLVPSSFRFGLVFGVFPYCSKIHTKGLCFLSNQYCYHYYYLKSLNSYVRLGSFRASNIIVICCKQKKQTFKYVPGIRNHLGNHAVIFVWEVKLAGWNEFMWDILGARKQTWKCFIPIFQRQNHALVVYGPNIQGLAVDLHY